MLCIIFLYKTSSKNASSHYLWNLICRINKLHMVGLLNCELLNVIHTFSQKLYNLFLKVYYPENFEKEIYQIKY